MARSGNLDGMATWNEIDWNRVELRSKRLSMTQCRLADAAEIAQIVADPRMHKYLGPPPASMEDSLARSIKSQQAGERVDLVVRQISGERVVGMVSLSTPKRRSPEVGCWIAADRWARGFAPEAVNLLVEYAFEHEFCRVKWATDIANTASMKVAIRTGFSFEGVARHGVKRGSSPVDQAVFSRLANDAGQPIKPSWPAMSQLSDGVVTVRPMTAEDWPTVLAEGSNDESLGWGFGGTFTQADAVARSAMAPLDWLVGRQANMLICDAATGAGAGTLTFRHVGPPNVVGIGYGILPGFRGRRFTSRALNLVSDWAFSATPIVRLELGCKVGNLASARSAEAAGFVADARYTGRLRNPDGSYSDEIGYGKVRSG